MRTVLLPVFCMLASGLFAQTPTPTDSQKIILTSLNRGDTVRVGDTVSVDWVCIDNIIAVDIRFSPDAGKTWILLNGSSIGYMDTKSFGHWKWVVPEKVKENPPGTNEFTLAGDSKCLFRVENYSPADPTEISISPKNMTILAGSAVMFPVRRDARAPSLNFNATLSRGTLPAMRFFDARGRALSASNGMVSGLVIGVIPGGPQQKWSVRKAAYLRQR